MNKKRRIIGLLVSGIMDQFTESLCRGVMSECEENDISMVVFPGKYLDRDLSGQPEIMYEYQFNTIFEYADTKKIDGLIVSASNIGCFSGDERVRSMLEAYDDMPYLLVASKWDDHPSINYDNKAGVKEGLKYLIEKQGCRKFAMLGGPEGNLDARERRDVFVETLNEYGIEIKKHQIVYGNLEKYNPDECNKLLDDNPDVDAIFCVNDDTAMGLYEVMKKRDLVPGKDIRVFGYDNTIEGAKATPALSTVGSDAKNLGVRAVRMLMEMLDGKPVEPILLPARFIKRESACDDRFDGDDSAMTTDTENLFSDIFYRFSNEDTGSEKGLKELFFDLVSCIASAADNDNLYEGNLYEMMSVLDRMLDMNALEYADMEDLIRNIEKYCKKLLKNENDSERKYAIRCFADELYKKLLLNMDQRAGSIRRDRLDDIYSMKIFVMQSMQFIKGNDAAYSELTKSLDWLRVKNAYLYIFEKPVSHLWQEIFQRPGVVYLKAYMNDGKVYSVPPGKQKTLTGDLFDNRYISSDRSNLVLFPLFYNEVQYGLLLCDLNEVIFSSGEFLTNQAGSAVRMIHLLRENDTMMKQLEETLGSLRENNIVLDNLSRQDALTGIYNRRGYMDECRNLIKRNRENGLDTLIAYVDMNNLKIINDRYGHEDGDFALKMISEVLTEITCDKGVVGRIGGDEYSFALTMSDNTDAASLIRSIHALFDEKNKTSEKSYNVTVSVGTYLLGQTNSVELEDALSYADESLYAAKQNKVRFVEKI